VISTFRKLFEPIKIGKVEIKNRIAMAPMGLAGVFKENGSPGRRVIDYLLERARGGIGLIITGNFKVENKINAMIPGHSFISHAVLAPFSELAEAVHAFGSKIFIQLSGGMGRVGNPMGSQISYCERPPAPSPVPSYWNPKVICRELKTEEVEYIVESFGKAAEICAAAGMDGVEIHGVHEGMLIDQFAIALFNKRTDKYGGDLRGRLRFATEIVKEIKKKVGKDFPVGLRFSIKSYIKDWNQGGLPDEEFEEKGRDTEEGLEAAKILEEAGYDALDADAGSFEAWYWAQPPLYQKHGLYLPLTGKLRKVVKIPVIVSGRMEIPELAEKAIEEGLADMVALGRGVLADPYWVKKIEEGRAEYIRPCLGCHDGCGGRIMLGRPVSCAVNPAAGRERDYKLEPTQKRKKVIVVGGGVSGLEVARIASLRGHQVTLFEKSTSLGGHLIEASVPDFKKDLERLLAWYKLEMEDLNTSLKIRLGVECTEELIRMENPDITILATGSKPILPDFHGIYKDKVATAPDVLLGRKEVGQKVVVVGGGLIGCETALWLVKQGKKVTIAETLGELMVGGLPVPHPNRMMLLDLLKLNRVDTITHHSLLEVTDQSVLVISKESQRKELESDTVVLTLGLKSDNTLYKALLGKISNLYLIGDAREPRNIMGSIWDAYEVARVI